MMKTDPAIDAVRVVRHKISELVGHDPQRLVDYYRKRQEQYRNRLVSREADEVKQEDGDAT
jgi:hypothetical protein